MILTRFLCCNVCVHVDLSSPRISFLSVFALIF
jgi:hypothetical protein